MSRTLVRLSALAMALAVSLQLAACADPGIAFVDESRTVDEATLMEILESADSGDLEKQPTTDSEALRHEAMVELRAEGDEAAAAADLLTRTFPRTTRAVPYYVERAIYSGQTVYVIVEATGRQGTSLTDKRLWLLSPDGRVILTKMR